MSESRVQLGEPRGDKSHPFLAFTFVSARFLFDFPSRLYESIGLM